MPRAALVTAFRGPVEVRDVPLPALEPSAVLAEVDAATLCGSDVHFWEGQLGNETLPYIPGHETAGRVAEVNGERYDILGSRLRPGDRILWAYPWCGRCYFCSVTNQPTLCQEAARFGRQRIDDYPHLLGGCAEYHYVPAGSAVIRIPDDVSSPLAASSACALRTVMHGFELLGALASHETVVIQGSGPIGLYALAVARDKGAKRVLVIGAPATRLEIAREWGADETLSIEDVADAGRRHEWVMQRTEGRGADVTLQCAGSAAIAEGLQMTRQGGRFVSIGVGGPEQPISARQLGNKTYIGFRSGSARHYHSALAFLATRRGVNYERVLSTRFPLDRVHEALEGMASGREVKPVILPR